MPAGSNASFVGANRQANRQSIEHKRGFACVVLLARVSGQISGSENTGFLPMRFDRQITFPALYVHIARSKTYSAGMAKQQWPLTFPALRICQYLRPGSWNRVGNIRTAFRAFWANVVVDRIGG